MLNKEKLYKQFVLEFSDLLKEETKKQQCNKIVLLCIQRREKYKLTWYNLKK